MELPQLVGGPEREGVGAPQLAALIGRTAVCSVIRAAVVIYFAMTATATTVFAQVTAADSVGHDGATNDSTVAQPSQPCDGLIVRSVDVTPQRPAFRGNMARWRRIARSLGFHHTTTRPQIVRRFVTLDPELPCTEFRRAETERILRAQPYLASATVRTLPDGAGGAVVEVETVDEASALIGGRLHRGRIASVSLGNENLLGLAMRVEAEAEHGFAYRDGYGLSLTHHQLFGKPYTLRVEGERRPVGEEWRVEAGHAFLTDLQRIAWHAGVTGRHDYLGLRRLEDSETTLPVRANRYNIGGVIRLGPPGRLWLLGGVLTGERITPASQAVIVTDSGFQNPPPDGAALAYRPFRATRLNVVTGIRALNFTTARGLDALTGEQDIARGIQLGLIAGRALYDLDSDADDLLLGGDIFAGIGGPWSYLAMRLEGEGRRVLGGNAWDGVIGSGRLAWYLKEARRWTVIASAEASGGWHSRLPMGLTLGEREGVRGFRRRDNEAFGARRLVTRLEQRWAAGSIRNADVGIALFTDAGRLWAGDLPYGSSTPTVASAGIALLAAIPRGGQRTWRLDIATPVRGGVRKLEFRLSSDDRTRTFWREPQKVTYARSSAGLAEIFSWP